MTTININQLDRYSDNSEYAIVVQFTIGGFTASPELHSKVYDERDALRIAQNLAETWRAFYASRAADRAVVVEVWDTATTQPERIGVFEIGNDGIRSSAGIVWS